MGSTDNHGIYRKGIEVPDICEPQEIVGRVVSEMVEHMLESEVVRNDLKAGTHTFAVDIKMVSKETERLREQATQDSINQQKEEWQNGGN